MTYIQKRWRETAVYFFVCLVLSLLFALLTIKDHGPNSAPPGNAVLAIVEAWRELGFPLGVLASLLGFRGLGTDVSKGLGDFLLTRPRSRQYFIWAGWAGGVAEVVAILMSVTLFVVALLYQEDGPFWRHLPPTVMLDQKATAVDLPLVAASLLIFAVVAYSATYFVEVVTRGRSSLLVICLLFLYDYFTRGPGWMHSHLPSLLIRPYYALMPQQPVNAYKAEIFALIAWSAAALLFPHLAQLIFERSDT